MKIDRFVRVMLVMVVSLLAINCAKDFNSFSDTFPRLLSDSTTNTGATPREITQPNKPTRDQAIQVLRSYADALLARDYDRAASLIRLPRNQDIEKVKRGLAEVGEIKDLAEVLRRSIDILTRSGTWGKAREVLNYTNYGSNEQKIGERRIREAGVSVDECYGLSARIRGNHNHIYAVFYFDGKGLRIIEYSFDW